MSSAIRFISLDKDLEAIKYVSQFANKKIIFEYKNSWYYLIDGIPSISSAIINSFATYAGYKENKDLDETVWAVSKDIQKVINWVNEEQVRTEDLQAA